MSRRLGARPRRAAVEPRGAPSRGPSLLEFIADGGPLFELANDLYMLLSDLKHAHWLVLKVQELGGWSSDKAERLFHCGTTLLGNVIM